VSNEVTSLFCHLISVLQLAAIDNGDVLNGLVTRSGLVSLNLFDKGIVMNNSSENSVLVVEMRCGSEANEELRAIGIRASVGHGEHTLVSVRVPYLLVIELLTVDRNTTSSIAGSGVTTLSHEALNNSVELVTFVVLAIATVLTSAKTSKVLA